MPIRQNEQLRDTTGVGGGPGYSVEKDRWAVCSVGFVGEGERSGLLERDWASLARLGQPRKPVLRGRQEAGLGLLQAGGATDETSDFGQ